MSVDLGSELEARSLDPTVLLDGYADNALIALPAHVARQANQALVRDPTDAEPWHGLVVGKKTEGVQRRLARASSWIVPPQDPCGVPYD